MKHYTALLILVPLFLMGYGRLEAQDTPENAEFKLALGLYNDGLYELAEDQFKVFVEKFPSASLSIDARYYLGQCQLKRNNLAGARTTFHDFALRYSDNPKAPDAWWFVGEAFEQMRNYPEAASAFSRIKTFYPKHSKAPAALVAASRNYLKADDIENAKLVLNSVIQEYPQSDAVKEANFTLGEIYAAEGEFQKALREFNRMASSPDVPTDLKARTIVAIGAVQDNLGERQSAEISFQQVIASYPKSKAAYEAYVRLGNVQRKQGKCAEAELNYSTVMKNPDAPAAVRQDAYRGAADCAARAGDQTRASKLYSEMFAAFKGIPAAPEIYLDAARAAKSAGNFQLAATYLETLYNDTLQHTDKPLILAEIARIAAEGGNYNEAVQRYQEYASKYPANPGAPFALLELGKIYSAQFRNQTQAVELFSRIVDAYNSSAVADEAQFRKAQSYETAADFTGAKEAYSQMLAQFPSSSFADEAERRIQAIDRFQQGNADDAVRRIVEVLSAMNTQQGSADAEYLLANLYLYDLKKYDEAASHYASAEQKGLAGVNAEHAAFGKAIAAARKFQSGSGSKSDAETQLSQFIQRYPQATDKEAAAFELFQLRSENASDADRLAACEDYIATGSKERLIEVRLARGNALRGLGKTVDAEAEFASIISGFSADPKHAQAYYLRGITRTAASNFTGAKDDLSTYIQKSAYSKYSAAALLELGNVSARLGDYQTAAKSFETLAQRFPYSRLKSDAETAMLNALTEGGMNERAVFKARESWSAASQNPFVPEKDAAQCLYRYSVVLAKAKDAAGAKKALHEYIERFPAGANISDAYFALGQMYKDEGKINLASLYLQQAGSKGNNMQAGRAAADMYMDNGNYLAAVRAYRALAASDQTVVGKTYAQSRAVVALFRADSLSEALKEADAFKAAYPDAGSIAEEFTIEQGRHYFRKKQYESAENYFEQAEDSDNKEIAALAQYWLGRTLEERNLNDKAKEKYADVIEEFPKTEAGILCLLALGKMELRAEKYQDAAVQYKKVVDTEGVGDAQLKEALSGLITCFDFLQYFDAAIEMTKRFIAAYPNDPTVFRKKVDMGQFYYSLRYFDQAITHLESLLKEAPADDQAEIRFYIGESYFYKGDFKQAALEFLKVPYLVVQKTEIDWASSAYGYAGKAYEELAKYSLAIEMYQKIIDTPGADPRFKAEASKNIERIKKLTE